MKTKPVFCANCQQITNHTIMVDGNGEYVFTCSVCGRFLKFPSTSSADELKDALDAHKAANQGQVSMEAAEKALVEKLDQI